MQLPNIDRSHSLHPTGAELAAAGVGQAVPVAPGNPVVQPSAILSPTPGVVDMVNPALKAHPPTQAPPQPGQSSANGDGAVVQQGSGTPIPEHTKKQDPPPQPLADMLLSQLKSVWNASTNAVQVEQVKGHVTTPTPIHPGEVTGTAAREVLTYQPARIKKNERV